MLVEVQVRDAVDAIDKCVPSFRSHKVEGFEVGVADVVGSFLSSHS